MAPASRAAADPAPLRGPCLDLEHGTAHSTPARAIPQRLRCRGQRHPGSDGRPIRTGLIPIPPGPQPARARADRPPERRKRTFTAPAPASAAMPSTTASRSSCFSNDPSFCPAVCLMSPRYRPVAAGARRCRLDGSRRTHGAAAGLYAPVAGLCPGSRTASEKNCLRRCFVRPCLACHPGDHVEARVRQMFGDELRCEELGLHRHVVPVGVCEMPVTLADLEAEHCIAPGCQNAEKIGKYPREFRRRRMDNRIPGEHPAQLLSAKGRSASPPISKLSSGMDRRATSIIPPDTSIPKCLTPWDASIRVMRPDPQPASTTERGAPLGHVVTNASIMPRSIGASKPASGSRLA